MVLTIYIWKLVIPVQYLLNTVLTLSLAPSCAGLVWSIHNTAHIEQEAAEAARVRLEELVQREETKPVSLLTTKNPQEGTC